MLVGLAYPLALCMRETYRKVIVARKSQDNELESWTAHAKRLKTHLEAGFGITVVRPVQMFITEPMLAMLCIYQFFVFGSYYTLIAAMPDVFSEHTDSTSALRASIIFLHSSDLWEAP